MSRIKLTLFCLTLALAAGCYKAPGHGDVTPVPPTPGDLESSIKSFLHSYPDDISAALRKVADECPGFKGWDEFQTAVQDATRDARTEAQKGFNDAMTEKLNPKEAPWDAVKAAAVLREAADGFEGGRK